MHRTQALHAEFTHLSKNFPFVPQNVTRGMRSRVYRSAYFWSYFRPGVAIFHASFQICNNQYDDKHS